MSILDEIIAHKITEVAQRKELKPLKLLENSIYFNTPVVSMKAYLQRADKVGVIAEIKRKSPGAGMIHEFIDVEQLSIGYMQAGASALSVLSDTNYFGGTNEDVTTARKYNYCPILRKDFTVDEYQIIEARSIGADCILLIAAALSVEKSKALAKLAKELGLEVLLETRDAQEINDYTNEYIDLVGVNNRNLHNFKTSIQTSIELADTIPAGFVKVSESGITTAEDIIMLKKAGYAGYLIGGHFMKHAHPEDACAQLIKEVQQLQ